MLVPQLQEEYNFSFDTEVVQYIPEAIDEYLVIVKDANDWEEVHNYIIHENEIDGIPNRKIECFNIQEFSLRSSVYLMSIQESEILKQHPKVERVELNPDKYPQPQTPDTLRYKKPIGFSKPRVVANLDNVDITYTNNLRSNWSHLFANNQSSLPFRGVGVATTGKINSDMPYSLTGKNIDAVIIDSGVTPLHPEFLNDDGTSRVKDVILDGPYKVDSEYFDTNGYTYTKIVDGVNLGVGIATTAAHEWWQNSSARSAKFQSLGTVSINVLYTLGHVSTKTVNSDTNQLIDGHGTACASQIGGKTFGLATECNLWGLRSALSGTGGYMSVASCLNICAIWHNAKKLVSDDPDPTLINNSYGQTSSTGNTSGTSYTHGYRGSTLSYTGTGNAASVATNSGACRNHKYFTVNVSGSSATYFYGGSGEYTPVSAGESTSSAAENAISAGCIVVTSAGNQNQKFSDYTDLDYNNWYSTNTNYINRVGGISKGFSGLDERTKGSIRVGALDCGVEAADSKQGATPYSIRKVCYSNCGPMINLWAPGEMTLAAGYTTAYESYVRNDDSNFYDHWFNGTSAASPNACSVIALCLQINRSFKQSDVVDWIDRHGTVEIDLSDPYDNPTESGYWSLTVNATFDASSKQYDSYNVRGNSSLRGATKRVLRNPYASNNPPSIKGVNINNVNFKINS
jgi:hypothetical protein